jgi:hypothetical protein
LPACGAGAPATLFAPPLQQPQQLQNFTVEALPFTPRRSIMYREDQPQQPQPGPHHTEFPERTMKTPIVAVAVLAYAVLVTAWICYTELMMP